MNTIRIEKGLKKFKGCKIEMSEEQLFEKLCVIEHEWNVGKATNNKYEIANAAWHVTDSIAFIGAHAVFTIEIISQFKSFLLEVLDHVKLRKSYAFPYIMGEESYNKLNLLEHNAAIFNKLGIAAERT